MSIFREKRFVKTLKNLSFRAFDLLNKYYFVLIGLYFLRSAILTALNSNTGIDYKAYLFLLAFASFTAYSELRKDIKWLPFLALCVPFLIFVSYLNVHGYALWGKMLSWQMSKDIVIDLNPLFSKIPLNDAAFVRAYKSETLTWFLRLVYNNGFVLPVLLPLYRAAISKDFKKMLRYGLSGHIVQVFLITPFYLMFHLQEVWYVLGHPDGLARNLSPQAAAGVTLNCFPSMHTSIAFAMFLLVLRERNKAFKYIWGFYCLSVVFSTMYLEIHWIIDVIAGMLLAYVTVKLVDFVLDKGKILISNLLNSYYYSRPTSSTSYVNNYYINSID
ncbi:phosphatase PAP2 family protein [Clostridium sp. CX1]|uniref:phosphatase PAP2 family protein n=1 Tax=Clostridium sp. CX1 TaxID=2978346 RepID=UPI0021C1B438|nr:phosphatase PAP2 family protein [Clostridium sp. CX1]MCT8976378.1 phosphatase PAP2 family protein [Clostridium sp. CX1]